MSNAERFLDAYASIEHALTVIVKDTRYIPYQQLLFKAQKYSWVVSKNLQELREYGELRNALVHLRDGKNEVIAEPTDTVTKDIERIAKLLTSNDNVMQYVSQPVQTVSLQDTIVDTYKIMEKMDTTKVPVYCKDEFVGVLKVESVCKWAMNHSDKKYVKDIMNDDSKKSILFLKKEATVQDVMDAYERSIQSGIQLLAILVTEHGEMSEKPLGILTTKDLPKVLEAFL